MVTRCKFETNHFDNQIRIELSQKAIEPSQQIRKVVRFQISGNEWEEKESLQAKTRVIKIEQVK